jgi:hypothetical protein
MKDESKVFSSKEYGRLRKNKDLGLLILAGVLILGADYIDYRNSFKSEEASEDYVVENTYESHYDGISYENNYLRTYIKRDPFLPSEDSTSFVRRTIKNDNPVRKLKKKR